MSAAEPTSRHELDDRLADANMFAWYVPSFQLAFKHWPISLAASLAALLLNQAFVFLLSLFAFPFTACHGGCRPLTVCLARSPTWQSLPSRTASSRRGRTSAPSTNGAS